MQVTLQYVAGCPNVQVTRDRLALVADELGLVVTTELVETPEAAQARGFRGSPTVLVDGRDPFADAASPVGLACRLYATADGTVGAPTLEQLRAVLS